MKYSELEKILKKAGCYYSWTSKNGHPYWYSPITKQDVKMSNHKSQEVKKGTLNKILKEAGLK